MPCFSFVLEFVMIPEFWVGFGAACFLIEVTACIVSLFVEKDYNDKQQKVARTKNW